MQFCNDCGAVLNLLEFPDDELCSSCRKVKGRQQTCAKRQQPSGAPANVGMDLSKAVLSCENNNIVLKSPEGWLLWSGPQSESVTFEKIVGRAERILEIRQRRQKKESDK